MSLERISSIQTAQGRINASQQSRELRKGESSRTGELAAQVEHRAYNLRPRNVDPDTLQNRSESETRPYNLRPRNVDPDTLQTRSESETRRMQQKQRRKQLAEESASRHRNKIRRMLDRLARIPKRPPSDDEKNGYKTVIFNADESALRNVWHPYHHTLDIGYSCTLKEASWEVEMSVLQIAHSVVALQSLTGEKQLFSCSGTIFEVSEGNGFVVTVANLVKSPDTDELAENLKIKVYLQKREVLDGDLLSYDFYHNICVIKIEIARPLHIPEKIFSSNIWAINFDESCPKDVVALSRNRRTHILHVSTGKIIPKDSELDCEELMVSSCKISKEAVGGLLMDFDGNIIGMNYYHSKETPFIPSFIVSKCLLQLKKSCKVVRPWHGLRVRNLYAEGHGTYEDTQTILSAINGVIIKKMEDRFSEAAVDLYEGDIIDRVNGVKFSNAAELGGILLDIGAEHDDSKGMEIYLKFGLRDGEREGTVVVKNSTFGGLNRWPFPKPIIVRHFCRGALVGEEWFTLEL